MAGFDLGRVIGAVLSGGAAPQRRGSPMGYGTRRPPSGNAQLGRALAGLASIADNKVGTAQKIVGLCARIVASTLSGVGRSGSSTAVAPTDIGNDMPLPRP